MWKTLVLFFAVCSGISCQDADEDVVHVRELTKFDVEVQSQRIMGGSPAQIVMFPYVVQVIRNNQFICGGSLLTTKTVLSAAQCFVESNGNLANRRQFTIRAGTAQLNSGGSTRDVSNIINHPRYNRVTRDNDVSVVILSRGFSVSDQIRLAALASNAPADNTAVTNVGWGATFPSQNPNAPAPLSQSLQQVSVNVVNNIQCATLYNQLNMQGVAGGPFVVTANMTCTGVMQVQGRGACTGDQGSPVVLNGLVVGITSWGYSCGDPNYPWVNSRIASHVRWITDTVERNHSPASQASVVIVLASLISALRLFLI